MNFKYCKRCNHLYRYGDENLCSDCIKYLDELMREVRHFLYDNPDAGIAEVAKGVEADEFDVLYLLREGRLSIKSDSIHCLKCGKPIDSGKYCDHCTQEIKTKLNSVIKDYKSNAKDAGNKGYISKEKNPDPANGDKFAYYTRKN